MSTTVVIPGAAPLPFYVGGPYHGQPLAYRGTNPPVVRLPDPTNTYTMHSTWDPSEPDKIDIGIDCPRWAEYRFQTVAWAWAIRTPIGDEVAVIRYLEGWVTTDEPHPYTAIARAHGLTP